MHGATVAPGRGWSWALILGVVLAVASCGDDSDGAGNTDAGAAGEPEVSAVVEPFPFTRVLSDDAAALLQAVDADTGTLTFSDGSPELDGLEPDRIVVIPPSELAPHGMLRRIDSVERAAGELQLHTRQASILHAFRRVDVRVEAGGPAMALPDYPTALSAASSGSYPFSHDIDWVVFDGDKNPATTEDRVLVTGELVAEVGYTFTLAFDWGALEDILECLDDPDLSCIEALNPLQVASDIGFSMTFVSDLSASADLDVTGAAALSFEREIELGAPLYLGAIPAGPIVLTPRLAASAGVRGGATAALAIELAVEGGVEFGLKANGAVVTPVGKAPHLGTPTGSASIQNTASARAWVNPRVELLIYDVVGPTIGLEPYAEVRADTEQDPCWHLSAGLDATLGVHLGVGPVTLISESRSVPIESAEFASGDCPLPPGASGSLDPTFTPWAVGVAGPLYSVGSAGDSSALAPTHDGSFLFTASTSTGLLKLDAQGEALWLREYVRDDLETLYPQRALSLADASLLIVGRRGAVLRTDEVGALLDAQLLDVADDPNTRVGAAARADDGGAWFAGSTPLADGTVDGWVVRFQPDGTLRDAFAIRGPLDERPRALVLLADGGALVAGEALDAGASRGWALRLDEDGAPLWFVRVLDCAPEGGLGEDSLAIAAASLTKDGNFALAGHSFYPDFRGLLVKLAQADGSLAWGRTYAAGAGLGVQLEAVASLESGGFLIAGTDVDIGPNDALLLGETDSAGSVAWLQRYDTPGRDGHASLWRTPADNGVWLGATASALVGDQDSALVLKVPRKHGMIAFGAGSGASATTLTSSDAGVCLGAEPYAGGSVVAIEAQLSPLPGVTDSSEPLDAQPLTD